MPKIKVKLAIKKDAWNWWDACNRISHGVDWKKKVDKELWQKIHGKTEKMAIEFLLPYLKNYYQQNGKQLTAAIKETQDVFNKQSAVALRLMEKITGKKLYRENFTCFLTTFPRCPYSFKKGYVWLAADWRVECCLSIFLHELLHFQFLKYFYKKLVPKKLNDRQFDFLKEALTVILNHEFRKYLCQKDRGYAVHKSLRTKLDAHWRRYHDFDRLIECGVWDVTRKII